MAVVTSILPGGLGLLEMKGAFLGGEEVDEFRDAVGKFVERGEKKLLVDVGGVTYLNSTAVGVLVAAHISYTRRNWRLILCGANKAVYSMLAMTKLNMVLTTCDTRTEAIRKFAV